MRSLVLGVVLAVAACGESGVAPSPVGENPLTQVPPGGDTDAAPPDCSKQPACTVVSADEEQATMMVRCDVAPVTEGACTQTEPGLYRCPVGCVRTPARDCDLCAPSRAFQCAEGHAPTDCKTFSEGRACCL